MQTAGVQTNVQAGAVPEPSISDFIELMKPRVMSLVLFTALVGMITAPGTLHPLIAFISLLAIAVGAGASGALNMWYDADIDAHMARTASRPIPRGRVTPDEALSFGVVLSIGSVLTLGVLVNWVAGAILAATIAFYIFIYTMWLKRAHAAEHRDRRCCWFVPSNDWVGRGDGYGFNREHCDVLDYLPLDTAAFLGARALSLPGL